MAKWAYVENGKIKECLDSLPQSWNNISNFYAAENDLEFLASYGWYPVVGTEHVFDPSKQKIQEIKYFLDESGEVKEELVFIDLPKPDYKENYERFVHEIRQQRDLLLKQSDWTQLVDVVKSKGNDWVESWQSYRQRLRDITNHYPYKPDMDQSINDVIWPKAPEK